ncbi:hypothetical protein QQS21_010549 [Conoideocrella luteorostrata]|uniref:Antifreeze protein n=1 Tax=Conoideocrella luteorostrata TaxID=1105319 RepID=A0AAJ0CEZ6_9HYPO|nr:hypothetical protein QQS21_010549 [Conoideocrella luteorostrata]
MKFTAAVISAIFGLALANPMDQGMKPAGSLTTATGAAASLRNRALPSMAPSKKMKDARMATNASVVTDATMGAEKGAKKAAKMAGMALDARMAPKASAATDALKDTKSGAKKAGMELDEAKPAKAGKMAKRAEIIAEMKKANAMSAVSAATSTVKGASAATAMPM